MAAGATTVDALENVLKTKYDQKKLHSMMYPDCAWLGSVRKDTNFGGNNARVTLRYGRPQGGSHSFGDAQSGITSSNDGAFLLTRAKDYYTCEITAEAMLAGEGSENTVLDTAKGEMEGCTLMFRRSISCQLYRNGGGARAKILSGKATKQITLTEPSDIVFFEVEMTLQASADDGSDPADTLRDAGAKEIVAAVDRDDGKLTSTSLTWDTVITAIADGDFLFRAGDFKLSAKGLLAWLPDTAPALGDPTFFGQDRSKDTTRLAGVRYVGAGGASKEDILIDASTRLGREGGVPDAVYTNNLDRADIIKNLMGKGSYELTKSTDGTIGYKALVLEGDKGQLKIYADPNCPKGRFFMLQMDTWVMKSIKGVPHLIQEDGQRMVRKTSADNFEWRYRALWQLGCEAPGFNLNGKYAA